MANQSYENHREIWRNPAVESTDIYPGLVVQDDRVGGSITIRSSRLPLWTLIGTAIREGWDEVQERWAPPRPRCWLGRASGTCGSLIATLSSLQTFRGKLYSKKPMLPSVCQKPSRPKNESERSIPKSRSNRSSPT